MDGVAVAVVLFVAIGALTLALAAHHFEQMRKTVEWCEQREVYFSEMFVAARGVSTFHGAHQIDGIGSGANFIPSKTGLEQLQLLWSMEQDRAPLYRSLAQSCNAVQAFEHMHPAPQTPRHLLSIKEKSNGNNTGRKPALYYRGNPILGTEPSRSRH